MINLRSLFIDQLFQKSLKADTKATKAFNF